MQFPILDILRNHRPGGNEEHGFWAPVPGTGKQAFYASTWAYVAEVVIGRLTSVGRIDVNTEGRQQGGLLFA